MDVIRSLEGYVAANLGLLAPVDRAWQPADFLPDLSAVDWVEQLTRFRRSATMLSDDVLAVLVGNMVTEEALPNYAVSLNQIVKDTTGTGDAPGRPGFAAGPPRRTATATCSTPTCGSPAGWTWRPSSGPSTT
jgi:Fatty acid desaturase